jgi:hypothetical protein
VKRRLDIAAREAKLSDLADAARKVLAGASFTIAQREQLHEITGCNGREGLPDRDAARIFLAWMAK